MLRRLRLRGLICSGLSLLVTALLLTSQGRAEEGKKPDQDAEPQLIIVKYGSLLVKSSLPDAAVYVDDIYKGRVDTVIESIMTGDHVISCRTENDNRAVWGTFQVRKNETLRLDARFDEGKLVAYHEAPKVVEVEKVEKKKPEPVKHERHKRPAPEPRKAEQRNPVEERRRAHLNVMKLDFDITGAPDVRIEHEAAHTVSRYAEKKKCVGKYYRTKQGVLLCDAGPCELTWSVSFIYTDEAGRADALLLNWKDTVFNGITPTGTDKRELECCLNGQCRKMQGDNGADSDREFDIDRYQLSWSKGSVDVRRADIIKEILNAGRSLNDYY